MRSLPIYLFIYFAMSQFDWPITKKEKEKRKKLWRLPKIESFILKCRVSLTLAH